MDWIKIEDKLPAFNQVVLLCVLRDGKPNLQLGYLSSIDVKGNHFKPHEPQSFAVFTTTAEINPTHWCRVTLPVETEEENEKNKVQNS